MVLLSDEKNKLLVQWKGPFVVNKRVRLYDYQVQLPRGANIFHGNLLKGYIERSLSREKSGLSDDTTTSQMNSQLDEATQGVVAAVIEVDDDHDL